MVEEATSEVEKDARREKIRKEVLTLRLKYNRHTEGDKVSIEGSAVEKTHRSVWVRRSGS